MLLFFVYLIWVAIISVVISIILVCVDSCDDDEDGVNYVNRDKIEMT